MAKYSIDAKSFAIKGFKYIIIYDETNKSAVLYAKKLSLEFGIKAIFLNDLQKKDKEDANISSSIIIVLGGDGFLLRVLHQFIEYRSVKFYGINFGTVGFLLNQKHNTQDLIKKIEDSILTTIIPLRADIIKEDLTTCKILAVNEISLLRQTNQACHIEIIINQKQQMKLLIADGIVVSTPAGSTAYNFSVHGPIFDPDSNMLSICPISPFRPRHWRGALVKNSSQITLKIQQLEKRPTSLSGDFYFEPNIKQATICVDKTKPINLLFDKDKTLSDKILEEQFVVD